MNHDSPDREEERLQEIIAAADRDAPEPDREFLAGLKTRSTLRFVEVAAGKSKRSRTMARIKRFAPRAIAAGLLLAIGATVVLLTVGPDNGAVWAEARKRIERAQGMRMTISVTGPDKTVYRARTVLATGGRMRQEMSISGQTMVMISDLRKGLVLSLVPDQKIAFTARLKDMPKAMRERVTRQGDQLAKLKRIVRNAEKKLGVKKIDGVRVKGYQVADESMTVDIWVHAETGLPVRMEIEMPDARMKGVMSDIEMVEKIDPGLFSTDVPGGYTVRKQPAVSMKPAGVKELTELLAAWAELTDGQLPDALDPVLFATVTKEAAKRLAASDKPPEQLNALMDRVSRTVSARLVGAIVLKQSNETFHYQGKGVKLGQKTTPVLWYKPEGKDKYVVIYGDLHVERVAPKDLPPKRTPAPK